MTEKDRDSCRKKVLEFIEPDVSEPAALSVIVKPSEPKHMEYANAEYLGISNSEKKVEQYRKRYESREKTEFAHFDKLGEAMKGKSFNVVIAVGGLDALEDEKRSEIIMTVDDYIQHQGKFNVAFKHDKDKACKTENLMRSLGYDVEPVFESDKLTEKVKDYWVLKTVKRVERPAHRLHENGDAPTILRPATSRYERVKRSFRRAAASAKKIDYSKVTGSSLIDISEYKPRDGSTKEKILINPREKAGDEVDVRIKRYLNLISNFNNLHTFELEEALKDKVNSEAAFDVYLEQDGYVTTQNFIKKYLKLRGITNLGKILEYGAGPGAPALKGILSAGVDFEKYIGIDLSSDWTERNKALFGNDKIEFWQGAVPYTTFSEEQFDTMLGTYFFECLTRAERYATVAQLNTNLSLGGRVIISMTGTDERYKEVSQELEDLLGSIGYAVARERKKVRLELGNGRAEEKRIYVLTATKEKDIDTKEAAKAYAALAYLEVGRGAEAGALYSDSDKLKAELSRIENIRIKEAKNGFRYDSGMHASLEELGRLSGRDPFEVIRENLVKNYNIAAANATIQLLKEAVSRGGDLTGVEILAGYRAKNVILSNAPLDYAYPPELDVFEIEKLAGLPVRALADRLHERYREERRVHKIRTDW